MTNAVLPASNPLPQPTGPVRERPDFRLFGGLMSRVARWVEARRARVSDCFVGFNDDGVELTLVGSQAAYDFQLNEELAAFTAELSVTTEVPVYALLFPSGSALGKPTGTTAFRLNLS